MMYNYLQNIRNQKTFENKDPSSGIHKTIKELSDILSKWDYEKDVNLPEPLLKFLSDNNAIEKSSIIYNTETLTLRECCIECIPKCIMDLVVNKDKMISGKYLIFLGVNLSDKKLVLNKYYDKDGKYLGEYNYPAHDPKVHISIRI